MPWDAAYSPISSATLSIVKTFDILPYNIQNSTWNDIHRWQRQFLSHLKLLDTVLKLTQATTKHQAVEIALKIFIQLEQQEQIRAYRGKLHWESDLNSLRENDDNCWFWVWKLFEFSISNGRIRKSSHSKTSCFAGADYSCKFSSGWFNFRPIFWNFYHIFRCKKAQ